MFRVTVLTLCGFRGGNEHLFEIVASYPFLSRLSYSRVLSRAAIAGPLATSPIGELACGYVLPSQFVDDSFAKVIR